MGEQTIHHCARIGDIGGLVAELNSGVAIETSDPETNRTPLMVAAASPDADVEMLRALVARGADVNRSASRPPSAGVDALQSLTDFLETAKETPAELASPMHDLRAMLDKSKSILAALPAVREDRETPLGLAIATGVHGKVEYLISAGADVAYTRSGGVRGSNRRHLRRLGRRGLRPAADGQVVNRGRCES